MLRRIHVTLVQSGGIQFRDRGAILKWKLERTTGNKILWYGSMVQVELYVVDLARPVKM